MKLPRMRVRVNQVDRKKKTGEETVGLVNGRYYGDTVTTGTRSPSSSPWLSSCPSLSP